MRADYVEKIKNDNSWLWDEDNTYYLICTDDLDSMLSCLLLLQYRPNWQIGGFFDYRDGIYHNIFLSESMTQDNTIWVDCSSIKSGDKCISNHLTSIAGEVHNINDINLNSIDNNYVDKSYFSKYNLSTFLLLISLLEHEIDDHVGRVLSLCFDSAYKPFYQPADFADASVQENYLLDVLELEAIYYTQNTMTKGQFIQIVDEQNLHTKLFVDDGGIKTKEDVDLEMICKYLNIDTDLSVLNGVFGLVQKSTSTNRSVNYMRNKDLQDSKITSYAITSRNNVSFSYAIA